MSCPIRLLLLTIVPFTLTSCLVGPNYQTPSAPSSTHYKEGEAIWHPAQPDEAVKRGAWWEIYHDPQLNALEEKVAISNQNVLYYEAQFRLAVATIQEERSNLFPTLTTSPGYSRVDSAGSGGGSSVLGKNSGSLRSSGSTNSYTVPVSLSYLVDVWGSVRRSLEGSKASAQASLADLENARLSYQSTLAIDYFQLKGLDAEMKLLQETTKSYEKSLELTQNRYKGGIASQSDVAQARTQLATTQAQLIDLGVARAQYEHAIAVLTGVPPAQLTVQFSPDAARIPVIPTGLPSRLLERRPDIAAAERRMAAANAQIGVQTAAYYPQFTLSGSASYASIQLSQLFSGPNLAWSVGPMLAQTLFDGGKIDSLVAEARDTYESTVATYRQTVLTAFQQIEDALSSLRILEQESHAQEEAVKDARQSLTIQTNQYQAGTVDYLTVITAQTTVLNNQVNAINVNTRRTVSSVQLIQALGGGWEVSQLKTGSGLEQAASEPTKAAKGK